MTVPKTGKDMYLYLNTGTVASPTWTEIAEVGDVAIDGMERTIAELKRRASDFTKGLAGIIGLITATFRLHHGLGATEFALLQAAFTNGTPSEWAIMDGDITVNGSEGWRCPFILSAFPWDQPLEDVSGHDCKLTIGYMEEPAATEIDPEWYTVSA